MSSQGPNLPSTAVDDSSVGSTSWTSPTNAELEDGVTTTAKVSDGA